MDAPQRITLNTPDGARLSVTRYEPFGDAPPQPLPVLLQHGLSANRFSFDFPGRSLAVHLASRGFDVFVTELRGAGRSTSPRRTWDLDDYLRFDIPAFVERVLEESGAEQLCWVGHSMGGILLMCHLIREPNTPIAAGICVGSALDYRPGNSGFRRLQRFRPSLRRVKRIPYGTLMRLVAPFLQRVGSTRIERFNFNTRNVEPELVRHVYRCGFEVIPTALLRSLGGTFDERGLRSSEGLYYREHADRISGPVHLIGGTADIQCPPEAVLATADLLGDACGEVQLFGRRHGHRHDYGHFDLLLGRRARLEVWPVIERWLRR